MLHTQYLLFKSGSHFLPVLWHIVLSLSIWLPFSYAIISMLSPSHTLEFEQDLQIAIIGDPLAQKMDDSHEIPNSNRLAASASARTQSIIT